MTLQLTPQFTDMKPWIATQQLEQQSASTKQNWYAYYFSWIEKGEAPTRKELI